MNLNRSKSYLSYKTADIYFIFSFALDFLKPYAKIVDRLESLGWEQGTPEDRKGRPPFLNIKRKNGVPDKYYSTSLFRRLLTTENMNLLFSEINGRTGKSNNENIEVELEAYGRIFDNGTGTITFKVSQNSNIDFRSIYKIHSLSQRVFNKEACFSEFEKTNKEKESLFDIFSNLLFSFLSSINDENTANEVNSLDNLNFVKFQDSEVLDFKKLNHIEAQNPYVLSVIELNDKVNTDRSASWLKRDRPRCKELAAILFRLVYPYSFFKNLRKEIKHVRIPFNLIRENDYIKNYAWDSRSLMWFSKTSSLFVCNEKSVIPASLIKNSLLDTLEIIRTRWHLSTMINAQLDQDIEKFHTEASIENLELLVNLNTRRKRFASFLHDPLPYIFEGGSVSEIAKLAGEEMQLNELRSKTIEKFETLDKLHSDQMTIIRLKEFEAIKISH